MLRDNVRPEAFAPMDDLREAVVDRINCRCGHPKVAHGPGGARECGYCAGECKEFTGVQLEPGSTLTETLAAIDDSILAMMEQTDEAAERYRALRSREDDPLTIGDLRSVVEWCIEESTRRPTGPPSSSTASLDTTGNILTGDSSSAGLQAA